MSWNINAQKGRVEEFSGSKTIGKINRSSLTVFQGVAHAQAFSVKYVLAGEEQYTVDGMPLKVKAGQALLVRPGQHLTVRINSDRQTRGVCVFIQPELWQSQFSDLNHDHLLFPRFPIAFGNISAFNPTHSTAFPPNVDRRLVHNARQVAHFLAQANHQLQTLKAKKTSTKLSLWEKLEQSRYYLQTHFGQHIQLDDIAAKAYLSPFHFQRSFKAFFGCSPHQYLQEIRLAKALEMLNQQKPVIEVADACGFQDVKYFKRCLKKWQQKS